MLVGAGVGGQTTLKAKQRLHKNGLQSKVQTNSSHFFFLL